MIKKEHFWKEQLITIVNETIKVLQSSGELPTPYMTIDMLSVADDVAINLDADKEHNVCIGNKA